MGKKTRGMEVEEKHLTLNPAFEIDFDCFWHAHMSLREMRERTRRLPSLFKPSHHTNDDGAKPPGTKLNHSAWPSTDPTTQFGAVMGVS